ncbi:BTAD domain-containing putative transcriptional regulator [Streptomyces sp. NPDC056308]|uniref:AfsR/SARP family transcriptional regulator n=1 Tax=Streptomyces sp. NPDC056308 TaxID=3345780 RepID=UPI0035DC17DB
MEFQLLGPVEAREGTRRIALSGSKAHTVLAVLLLARGRVVGDDRLSSLLWGWEPPVTMNAQIYTYISRLRKLLGPGVELIRRQPGYQLIAEGATVDAVEFERLDRQGRKALEERRFAEAEELLRRALDLWQGPALANVTPYLAEAELPQLEEARMSAVEHRIEADLALARHRRLVPELTGLVGEFPVRERLRGQLMTALYRCGRQAEALRTYHEARKVLAEELGVDPGSELTAKYQAVLSGELSLLPEPAHLPTSAPHSGPPSAVAPMSPVMLPPDIADFAGRKTQFTELCAQLTDTPADRRAGARPRRLLISGMAGVGKTALAVRVAHAVAAEFPDGLLHARLRHRDGTVKDSGQVLSHLLRALGERPEALLSPDGSRLQLDELIHLYRTRTAGRRLLLFLDDAASELQLDALLPATADAAVLVTSRNRQSAVPGFRTTPLYPMDGSESLALLSAIAGVSRIVTEPQASRALVDACGGLPLALRAAATRLAARPHWPASRLARNLAQPVTRLAELHVGDLDIGGRLGSALRLLPPHELEFTRALASCGPAVFSASAAAPLLCRSESATEEFLERLVEKSLLEMSGIDAAGEPHYRFHELVRLAALDSGGLALVANRTFSGAS